MIIVFTNFISSSTKTFLHIYEVAVMTYVEVVLIRNFLRTYGGFPLSPKMLWLQLYFPSILTVNCYSTVEILKIFIKTTCGLINVLFK